MARARLGHRELEDRESKEENAFTLICREKRSPSARPEVGWRGLKAPFFAFS
jgi:hypothetical protein